MSLSLIEADSYNLQLILSRLDPVIEGKVINKSAFDVRAMQPYPFDVDSKGKPESITDTIDVGRDSKGQDTHSRESLAALEIRAQLMGNCLATGEFEVAFALADYVWLRYVPLQKFLFPVLPTDEWQSRIADEKMYPWEKYGGISAYIVNSPDRKYKCPDSVFVEIVATRERAIARITLLEFIQRMSYGEYRLGWSFRSDDRVDSDFVSGERSEEVDPEDYKEQNDFEPNQTGLGMPIED